MRMRRPKGYWHLPGRLYDLAFSGLFRGARRRIARIVEADGLQPWLDVCCGTGDQFRRARGPGVGLDKSFGFVRYAAARTPRATFVCGDASRLPFRSGTFRAVSVSMALHDKSLELRRAIMAEARRMLGTGGLLVAVDFERPVDTASRAVTLVTRAIERFAGRAHYENGRDFLRRGGLRGFLRENGFVEVVRHDMAAGSISLVVARAEGDNACDSPPQEQNGVGLTHLLILRRTSMAKITMLGTGLIGAFYTQTLHGLRSRDRVVNVYSRTRERAKAFAAEKGIPRWSADLREAIQDSESEIVVVGLPNDRHLEAVRLAAEAGKAVLCTKPLGRTAAEALAMLRAVEKAGVFTGYLEDLVYTPKTLKALASTRNGAMGRVLWARSRETHPGPHSAWFWDPARSGGGAIIDMGCHCIEIGRNFIGKDKRPLRAFCWGATQVHPIEAEDHAIGLVEYEGGAVGQFEVSWTFRGGMDLRDEVSGTEGTIRLDHFLRTGFEMFTAAGEGGYVAEKAEGATGWLFPVGDEAHALGYVHMFQDMLDAREAGRPPMETFYDGYVVNAVIDACYKSMKSGRWEPIKLGDKVGAGPLEWLKKAPGRPQDAKSPGDQGVGRVGPGKAARRLKISAGGLTVIKVERLPDGRVKRILKDPATGRIVEKIG